MSKRWSEVIASPDYQNLSAQDKAAAQSQYFDSVVKPNLKPDEVDAAHEQFYNQYPVGSSSTSTPAPQPTEDKESFSYAIHHPGEAFDALGNALTTGAAKWLLTDRNTGETATPTGAAANWYQQQMANPETAHNADVVSTELPRAAIYGGTALATEGLGVPLLEAAGVGRVVPTVARVAGNVAGSVASQKAVDGSVSLGQTAGDVLAGEALHGLGRATSAVIKDIRSYLPESMGGISMAERVAPIADPNYVGNVISGGDTFRTATTDSNGNSILNPDQVFNTDEGAKYIRAQKRNQLIGDNSVFNQRKQQQLTGESVGRAIGDQNYAPELQQSAERVMQGHKERVNRMYTDAKSNAQEILDNAPVKITELKFPDTKELAQTHLDNNTANSNALLTTDARKTLNAFKESKITNLDDLDSWKRRLSEKSQKAFKSGDMDSYRALNSVKNNLRNEADDVIHSINPDAADIYEDADKYFAQTVEGYGKRSELQRIINAENEHGAGQRLLNRNYGQDRVLNLFRDINPQPGDTYDFGTQARNELAQSIGAESRNSAFNEATKGERFSPTVFSNQLRNSEGSVDVADIYSPRNESYIHYALKSAAERMKTTNANNVGRGFTPELSANSGRLIGGAAGTAIGTLVGGPLGAGVGSVVGGVLGGPVSRALSEGVLDRLVRNKNAIKYINFLSKPENAAKVADILQSEGGLNASTKAITNVIDTITSATTPIYNTAPSKPDNQTAYIPPEVIQQLPMNKQSTVKGDEFDSKTTNLYRALAHAETGGLSNRFIRTKAPESGLSTAYGPAQLLGSTMKDFYDRHSKMFNAKEREYVQAFLQQANIMKHAPKNDPVFGYGGSGILGDKDNRRMYANIVRKMLQQMIKDNGGSLEKTMHQWRGNDNDTAYFQKVRAHYHSLS
ncbi:TPA: hypothetical protein PCJ90_001346 [Klebsiella quasipneumoniae]|nr:hypothetical protein [Klebsiella quasipneumoniae]